MFWKQRMDRILEAIDDAEASLVFLCEINTVKQNELEPDASISALVGADGDDGVVMVHIYFYDSSVFQFGDNDATTAITKEIAALDKARGSGEIRKRSACQRAVPVSLPALEPLPRRRAKREMES